MEKRSRGIQVIFRVTPEERNMIQKRMEQSGIQNMRAYLLKMAVDGYVLNLDLSDVKELVYLLRNATNNINQIAKHANETHHVYSEDIYNIRRRVDEVWDKANGILERLAKL